MSARKKKDDILQKRKIYNDFIGQIEIIDVRLMSAKIENLGSMDYPSSAGIRVRRKAGYENREGGFDCSQRYNMTVTDTEKKKAAAKLSVVFSVAYTSGIPMSDELFNIFEEINLPLNTWPYFREFAHNSFGRMNWLGLIAPTYKI